MDQPKSTPTPPPLPQQPSVPPVPSATAPGAAKGLAVTALVLGIIAFLFGWLGLFSIFGAGNIVTAIAAIIFGIIALTKKQPKGLALTGLILGAVALLATVALIIVSTIGYASIADKAKNEYNNSSNYSSSSSNTSQATFGVNETATYDDKAVTVTGVQRNYSTGNEYIQPETGKEFVVVTVSIANNSSTPMSYSSYEFKIQDSNGVQQSESYASISEGLLNSGSLAPGGKVTGKIAFEVPAGDTSLKLIYDSYDFFSDPVTFNLQ